VDVLWTDSTVEDLRARWRELQLNFVDDPRGSVDNARVLAGEVVDALTIVVTQRRDGLDSWRSAGASDTEELRVVLRRYREFLDRVLGM